MQSPFASVGPAFEEEAGPAVLLDAIRQGSHGLLDHRSAQFSGRSSVDDGRLLQAVAAAAPGTAAVGGSLLRSATVANPLDVAELLAQADLLAAAGASPAASLSSAGSAGVNRAAWVQPSGRRQSGEGCEDVEQAVVLATSTPTGGALLRITLLAAGFCIGPSGASIRDVCKASQTDIKSWTAPPDEQCNRSCRVFRIEGPAHGVAKAVGIMCDAVDRYKELCEGKYAGQSVARIQHVSGVEFHYQPPPRSVVPFAASLKGQSSGGRGARAAAGKPPIAPHRHKGSSGPSRTGSLGVPSASAVPGPLPALSRSASVPGPGRAAHGGGASTAGGAAGSGENVPPTSQARRVVGLGSSKPEPHPGSGQGRSRPDSAGSGSSAREGTAGGSSGGHAQHAEQEAGAQLAPAQKLGKGDVLRSVFGSAEAAMAAAEPPRHPQERQAAPSSFDVGLLLQQLALQEAQEQAAAALALAAQQGVRGGYELTEPGVLLPASLSPLAPPPQQLPPMSAFDAQQAAQGLANSAEVLAAVAAAWQNAQAQQQAATDHLVQQLAAAGLLGPPHADHAAPAIGLCQRSSSAPLPPAGPAEAAMPVAASAGYGAAPQAEQHMPLSAFQGPSFTPFSTVGSPPDTGFARASSAGRSPSISPSPSPSISPNSPGASSPPPGGIPHPLQLPGTPDQLRSSAAAMPTPPGAHSRVGVGPMGQLGSPPFASAFAPVAGGAAAGRGFAGAAGGLSTSAGGSPFGSFLSLLHGEAGEFGAGAASDAAHGSSGASGARGPPLSLFSSASLPAPSSPVGLARAASVPGPQGSCTPLDRLDDMLSLARANSYAAPGDPAGGSGLAPPFAALNGLRPPGAPGPPSAFSSAFSPSRRSPPGGRLPPLPHGGGGIAGGGAAGHSAAVVGDVDRLLDALF
ncbi:hypothetical protein ABPG75_001098 [Micractinium tetrahymenae]